MTARRSKRETADVTLDATTDVQAPAARPAMSKVRLALIAVGAAIVLASPFWAPLAMRRMAFFRVRRVEILGAHYVAPSDILSRLNVDTLASIWDSTKPLAARIAAHPEIQTVDVGRKLPGTLVVEVTERIPVALVPANGGFRVYDDRGVSLPIDPTRVNVDVPVIAVRDTALLRFLGTMRDGLPALYARLSELRRAGRNELVLQLKTGAVRAMQDVSLERLADIDPVEADLARKQLRVTEIDLRFRDQVIARLQ